MSVKISQLGTASTPLTGIEIIPIVQSGETKKTTINDLVALAGGGSASSVDSNQIAFGGSPSGLTSSSSFTIDPNDGYLVFGDNSIITGGSTGSVILGGGGNTIATQSQISSIIGGYCNTLQCSSSVSSILGGRENTLQYLSNYSSMVGESMSKRFNGAIVGFLGGVILGALLRQNALMIGAVGGVIGYVVGNKNAPLT